MLRELISAAVRRYVTDGTGVLLSGGIDSATVAYFAPELPVFTGFYQGEAYDERPWARLISKDRDNFEIEITPQDFIDNIDSFLEAVNPPYEGPGGFGQYMVAKVVCNYVHTVLSGEGGDELFGGYARVHLVAGVPVPLGYESYERPEGYPSTLREALEWEWKVNLPRLLALDEQVTRAWGLKAIAPMLDTRLVNYVLSRPDSERVGKVMLKDAMYGYLPQAILERRDKRGFPVPYVEWAQGPLRDFIGERIGYIPDPEKPWDRKWWNDLCAGQTALV